MQIKEYFYMLEAKRLKTENEKLKKDIEESRIMYETIVKHATTLENELDDKLRRITAMSITDSLTNIFNRRKLTECMINEILKARKNNTPLSLVLYDIDHFKDINDKNGHEYGDVVLVATVNLIKDTIRQNDIFARWGGDEFMVLLPQINIYESVNLAEAMRNRVYNYYMGHEMPVTCSFGVTKLREDDDIKSFIIRADNALYEAKNHGRNSVRSIV